MVGQADASKRSRRGILGAVALGAVLTVAPVVVWSYPSGAQAPASDYFAPSEPGDPWRYKIASWQARIREKSAGAPKTGAKGRWGPWARGIILSNWMSCTRFSMKALLNESVFSRAKSRYRFIAARAVWGIRFAAITLNGFKK